MTDSEKKRDEAGEQESVDEDVKVWLKHALRDSEPPRQDVLEGVQRKIRQRSQGKFYSDRWSTAKQPPVLTYLITSALMLVLVIVMYLVLAPLRGKPEPVELEPKPVRVLPPP